MDTDDVQKQLTNLENTIQNDWVLTALSAMVIILVTATVSHFVSVFIKKVILQGKNDFLPSSSIFLNITRGIIWFAGICAILAICFDVNITAAIAALGVGGIALSLGLQDTISNLIGGLQVSLLKIIEPGDNIQIDNQKGLVSDIAWRHTTITTSTGEKVLVPNSVINNRTLIHLSPAELVVVPFAITTNEKNLDETSEAMIRACQSSLTGKYAPVDVPRILFTEITEYGIKGKLFFSVADPIHVNAAGSLAIQVIAPFTRGHDNDGSLSGDSSHAVAKIVK